MNIPGSLFSPPGSGGGGGGGKFVGNTQVILPPGVNIGPYVNGDIIPTDGLPFQEAYTLLCQTYLAPTFTAFSIVGYTSAIEVGVAISGSKTFNWATSNSSNVQANSINIIDVQTATPILSGSANDGTQNIVISVPNTSPLNYQYQIQGTNTKSNAITPRNFAITSIYPYFYGKVSAPGPGGTNRPVANQALIDSGTKVVASSAGTITVNYASASSDYIWFAVPSSQPLKTVWFVDALNNGSIGGAVSVGGNLFPSPDSISVTTVLWAGVLYNVYISNYQTAVGTIQFRNS